MARKILVNASYAPSLINFRGPLLAGLVEAGWEVHASAPSIDAATHARLESMRVKVHDVPLSRTGLSVLGDLAYFNAIRRLVKEQGIELVLGYTIKPCIWGSLAAASAGARSVSLVTGVGYVFDPSANLKHRAVSLVSRKLWAAATRVNEAVIFQNPDDLQLFLESGALRDRSIARLVAGSGVDMEHFARAPLPHKARFLMIARLLPNKGVREYAEAALKLVEEGVDASFALAGFFDEGPETIDRSEVERWQAGGLEFLGALDDVRPALREASVYVLPSYREGTPRTVLEAMSMGRAIITTDVPGCRETVRAESNGILVPVRDAESLQLAMRRLATDAVKRAEMGEQSRRFCENKFAIDKVNGKMFEYLGIAKS